MNNKADSLPKVFQSEIWLSVKIKSTNQCAFNCLFALSSLLFLYHLFSHWVLSDSWDAMDCGPPYPSVHGIFQERILEWVATAFSACPGIEPVFPALAGRFCTTWEGLLPTKLEIPAMEYSWGNTPLLPRLECEPSPISTEQIRAFVSQCLVSEGNTHTLMLLRRESHWPISLNFPFHTHPTLFPQNANLSVSKGRHRSRSTQHWAIINTWAVECSDQISPALYFFHHCCKGIRLRKTKN